MTVLLLQIAVLILLLFFSSVFSGSETALFSLKTYQIRRLERKPSRRAIRVVALLKDPYHLLVAVLVGNTLVNVAASSMGTSIVQRFFQHGIIAISVVSMSVLILIFGEIVPKTYAVNNPVRVSLTYSRIIASAVMFFSPLRGLFETMIRRILRLNIGRIPAKAASSDEAVVEAIAFGHSQGVLDAFERTVLGGLFKLTHLSVQNVMVPRTEVYMLSSNLPVAEAVSITKSSGYSRIPVFDADKRDCIVGILYAKDLLQRQGDQELRLGDVARPPFFVPESKPLVKLLKEFVSGAAHFAAVIDEYGTFTGIVTLDDILGEVIGRGGERWLEKYRYSRRSRTSWEVSGRMEIEYFSSLVGVALKGAHAETIAGYIIDKIGSIPPTGEALVIGGLRFRVLDSDGRRIKRLIVERTKK